MPDAVRPMTPLSGTSLAQPMGKAGCVRLRSRVRDQDRRVVVGASGTGAGSRRTAVRELQGARVHRPSTRSLPAPARAAEDRSRFTGDIMHSTRVWPHHDSVPTRTGATMAALLVALSLPTLAQSPAWSVEYDKSGVVGRIYTFTSCGGQLVAGGDFLQADGIDFGQVARFDGVGWKSLGGGVFGNEVRALAEFQGNLVAGGDFDLAGGNPVASVAGFDGTQWFSLGQGVERFGGLGRVNTLAVHQGDLYVGGDFDRAGGVAVGGIARWDGSQWHAVSSGVQGTMPIVRTLHSGSDGLLYVGGEFDSAGGTPNTARMAAWDGSSFVSLGGGFPGPLNTTVWDFEEFGGEVWTCGSFDLPGGANHEKIAIWNGVSWRAAAEVPDSAVSTRCHALEVLGGSIYVAGNIVEVDGVPVTRIARFDGSAWSGLGGVAGGAVVDSPIFGLHAHQGRLHVGGEFERAGPDPFALGGSRASESVATFDGVDWGLLGRGLGLSHPPKDVVRWQGDLVAIGGFSAIGAVSQTSAARFDGESWSDLAHFTGTPRAALVSGGDLIVAGDFDSVDSVPVEGVARFDGLQWSALGTGAGFNGYELEEYQGELYLGGLGGVLRLRAGTWQAFAPQVFGQVEAMEVHRGVLYYGGSFNGQPNLLTWDGTTQQGIVNVNGSVHALSSIGSMLYVGGDFTKIAGQTLPLLAAWDGSQWRGVGTPLTGVHVNEITEHLGEIYIGGNLFVPGFPPNKYVARFDGSAWTSLDGGLNGDASTLISDPNRGTLYAFGPFTKADGRPSWHMAEWSENVVSAGTTYCTAKTDSLGCVPGIGATGVPSVGGTQAFGVTAGPCSSGRVGTFFYGYLANNLPFQGGTLCVAPPIQRLKPRSTGGNPPPNDCSGSLTEDFAKRIRSGVDPLLIPGAQVFVQGWYRDPQDPGGFGVGLTRGLEFTVLP